MIKSFPPIRYGSRQRSMEFPMSGARNGPDGRLVKPFMPNLKENRKKVNRQVILDIRIIFR